MNIEFDGKLHPSELKYYQNLREENEFKIDQKKLQEYFPLNIVLKGTFHIYQVRTIYLFNILKWYGTDFLIFFVVFLSHSKLLLSLRFEEIKGSASYHPEVRLFRVLDKQSNHTVGYFYIDLHPREGKFGHACIVPVKVNNNK